ncbi:MAG: alpha/beta fold hydrolase [Candidatus Eremiobacteraeota bacterium]|nr:alpha/beta fold hydrolase [Candidatus Eremiobacteraeota bacterium]
MNLNDLIPPEAMELQDRNARYREIIFHSTTATRGDLERIKKELNLAPTPKEVIHEECSLRLYRYTPVRKKLHGTPLLIVPSLILRYHILDLLKGHSLIEHLVSRGIDTYLLDWGIPGDEHGALTLDYYIDTFLRRAARKVARFTGREKISLLGQCLGGTFAAVFTSLYPEKIERLICLTTPVDFHDAGLLSLWTSKENFNIDNVVESFGNVIPPEFIHGCFQFLDVKATVERYKKLYHNVLDENFLFYYRAMDQWINDKIPFPAQVFRRFIRDLYQENLLAQGRLLINGRAANPGAITCPVQVITAAKDHVFPEKAAQALTKLVSGPVEYHKIDAGHVTLVALFPQREETYGHITTFLGNGVLRVG